MRRKIATLVALLAAAVLLLSGCSEVLQAVVDVLPETTEDLPLAADVQEKPQADAADKAPAEQAGPIIEPQAIADYIFTYGELPDNFITKEEAQALGWDSSRNYVSDVAPGRSIGGDRFGNYEGVLPKAKGRTFRECDCNYTGGKRGGERIVYSSDGHVWYTDDHYETFTELFPSDSTK